MGGKDSVDAGVDALAYALDFVLGEWGRGVEDGDGVGASRPRFRCAWKDGGQDFLNALLEKYHSLDPACDQRVRGESTVQPTPLYLKRSIRLKS